MRARAARLHAAHDIRIDEFELPDIKDDEMLVRVISDSMCMSTYKMAIVISGEISSEGGKDFKLGICMIEKDDPTKDLMDIGTIRVWVDQDKFAARKQKYPYGD